MKPTSTCKSPKTYHMRDKRKNDQRETTGKNQVNIIKGKLPLGCIITLLIFITQITFIPQSVAQINLLNDYQNNTSSLIGTYQGIAFREAGFSGLYPIPNTNGKEFWTVSDRGVNIDAANANPASCHPTYDKIYAFPNYAPKIHRIRLLGDSIQILQSITIKRPNGTTVTGKINPTGLGSTALEVASTDTVLDCANFNLKTSPKDTFGIDSEGIVVDADGNFWLCEEGGPTIWKLNSAGVVIKRFTPYANLPGVQNVDVLIDTVFKYRKNNRGFEGIAMTPNGKIYAIIQSPILYPTKAVGEGTRIHRILEIDPSDNSTRMLVYLNDGIIGASGPDQIRLRDWKIGDMAAVNDSTFLVLEAALRGVTDIKRMYLININGATNVTSGLYSGVTLEALVDAAGLTANNIVPVTKTLFMDLLANGWDPVLEKAEGLAILNDSTILVGNDNDYGQFSPLENGIATATTNKSHVVIYGLQGNNKLTNFQVAPTAISNAFTGPNSSQSPYVLPAESGVTTTSILTVTDGVGGYHMAGIPDGLGAFDNNNGTFTLLMNHELNSSVGVVRAHGAIGAFVSKWVINKSDLSVVSGSDLINNIYTWNTSLNSFALGTTTINRFCSADLPKPSAFYNSASGLGTQERIFMNGEESGAEGRAFGNIATGPNAGTTYQLPWLGRFSWENVVANPFMANKTIVAGLDDSNNGQVYFYIGTKTNSGTEIDKAGLNNGKTYGLKVAGFPIERINSTTINNPPAPGTPFDLIDLGYLQNTSGAALEASSVAAGITAFSRPEDGVWDPSNPSDFYFLTTDQYDQVSDGVGSQVGRTRVYRLKFTDINNPEMGGTIEAVLNGTEGLNMLDNATMDNYGHLFLQEDVGNQQHNGKIWQYTVTNDSLKLIARHDAARFGDIGIPSTAPYSLDEESSGIIDMQEILGPGHFIIVDQAHYNSGIPSYAVEGGQLLALYNPDTYAASAEIQVAGNNNVIPDGDTIAVFSDNTDFGIVNAGSQILKTFVIQNTGITALSINGISFTGNNASDFSLLNGPTFPLLLQPNGSQSILVKYEPVSTGISTAEIQIANSDVDESVYNFTLMGTSICPVLTATITPGGPTTLCPSGGSVTLTANSSVSYLWSTGETTQSIVVTGAGSFTVTTTNTFGCTAQSASLTTVYNSAIAIVPSTINVSCNGGTNGSISTAVSGGTAPYGYLWSNGNTTSNATALIPGTYTVTITDALGCTATSQASITQPALLISNFAGSLPAVCGSNIGSLVANPSGGTTPYLYLWSNGSTTKTNSGLSPGTYTVTVTDFKGCSITRDTILPDTKINSVTVVTTKPSCNGGNNGSACATDISGGNGPFTYSWNTIPVQTTACATGLSKGFYVLTVTSADGCNFFSNVQIKQPAKLEVAIATGAHNANALASGGTKPYTYLWSNGKTIKKIYGLANGTYTVTVTDFNGCTKTATAIITGTAKMGETGIDISTDLNVYPNPADQEVSISFVSDGDETYTLNIIDYMGKTVFNKNAKTVTGENITEFNFGSYPAGIYIINIITQESVRTKRVIVK